MTIRYRLPFIPWTTREPASRWLTLLGYLCGFSVVDAEGRYQEKQLLLHPWLASIDAIEYLRLNSDSPCWPMDNSEPSTPSAVQPTRIDNDDESVLPNRVGLGKSDVAVLFQIALVPNKLWKLDDISVVSRSTASKSVNRLIMAHYAQRPRGKSTGVQITALGEVIASGLGFTPTIQSES